MARAAVQNRSHLPGEEGIWLFVIGDMIMFTALFSFFLYYRGQAPEVFQRSHLALDQGLGLFNTGLMLTSSWCVAAAVQAMRLGDQRVFRRLVGAAIGCGIGFGVVKYVEWSAKLTAGITFHTNDFFMFYFVLTGIHMGHVVIATLVLGFLRQTNWNGRPPSDVMIRNFESGGLFWHLVDLLWIILFALLYMLP